jgi:hypothetical protein
MGEHPQAPRRQSGHSSRCRFELVDMDQRLIDQRLIELMIGGDNARNPPTRLAARQFQGSHHQPMNLDQARRDLAQALDAQADPNADHRMRAARHVLVVRGTEALAIEPPTSGAVHDVIKAALGAPGTPARRAFAVLLVHALGVDGLVASRSNRGQLDRDVCRFIESALPTVLQRSNYPFGAETYEKRQLLGRLHTAIDELMKPLEPTFPPNVQGLYAG